MSPAKLEHVNVTVKDTAKTAEWMCEVFDWHIRWKGESVFGGETIHVGSKDSYLAIYSKGGTNPTNHSYDHVGGLNHLAIVVDDLDATESKVRAAGFVTGSHADYEPGRRFYFDDHDGIEFEVVSYA